MRAPDAEVTNTSVAGSVQVGVEYFLNRHLSFGIAIPAYTYPDWDTEARFNTTRGPNGAPLPRGVQHDSMNFSSIGGLLEIKVYLP